MADALYIKTADGPVKVEIEGGSGGISHKVFTSVSRSAVISSGTAWTVPSYTMGDNSLSVFVNGLLCIKGQQYAEASSTTITFTFDVPTDFELTAVVTNGTGDETRAVQTDTSRTAVISAGTAYTVPSHGVGEQRLQVYLDGLQYRDFAELSATQISFDIDIPTTMEIVVVVN